MSQATGFREIEHTADWELEVWAPTLPGLLEQAAQGMYQLSGVVLQPTPRITCRLRLDFQDLESLLVAFLNELLYELEINNRGFNQFALTLLADHLQAHLTGGQVLSIKKEIKAVTYHRLQVCQYEDLYHANVVFDV